MNWTLEAAPNRVKSRPVYALLNGLRLTKRKGGISAGEFAMLAFQLIGWALIVLFFAAMVGGHQRATNR
jgi:hypothetical protein